MRKKILSIVIVLVLTLSSSILMLSPANAHNPAITIPTMLYVSVSPNPVGVNQGVGITFWNSQPPPQGSDSIYWTYNVSLTDPNNQTIPLGQINSDATGHASVFYMPTVQGNWSVTVSFPQTVYNWSSTSGQQLYYNDTFQASSKTVAFTVQNSPVPTALPYEYTTSNNWFSVTSNYLGSSSPQITGSRYAKRLDNATGSLTSHVMWTKPLEAGGLVGGTDVGIPGDAFYSGGVYNLRFLSGTNTFILDGKLYYREPLGDSGASSGYIIVDLATGKEIARTSLTSSPGIGYSCNGITEFMTTSFGTWRDPNTLNTVANAPTLSSVPSGTNFLGPNGETLKISLSTSGSGSSQISTISQWNSSKVLFPGAPATVNAGTADKYDYTGVSVTYNGSPFLIPSTDRTILGGKIDDYLETVSSTSTPFTTRINFWTISLKPSNRGAVIANYTLSKNIPPFDAITEDLLWSTNVWDPDAHVIPFWSKRTFQWLGFNFLTGQAWGPTAPEDCWNYYASTDTSTVNTDYNTMNGHLLSVSWAGKIYCYNITTGKLEFTYGLSGQTPNANITSSGYQTIYGHYPCFIGALTPVNNRIYIGVTEHSPNTPLMKGAYMRCFDVATQTEDWILPCYGFERPATTSDGTTLIVANGFTVNFNAYEQQIFALAQGPSAITVSTTQQVTQGNNVLIKGTILDKATGTTQSEQIARFPNGVACVCDDNMTDWMTYVYEQRYPRPDVIGVNVRLQAVSPDGSTTEIGTVTSDDTGYFDCLWTPTAAGTYSINATFDGTAAYYQSTAQTSFTVTPKTLPTVTPTIKPETTNDSFIIYSGAAIMVLIAIVFATVLVTIKKLGGRIK